MTSDMSTGQDPSIAEINSGSLSNDTHPISKRKLGETRIRRLKVSKYLTHAETLF